MASSPFPSPTKTYHQTSYSAISPTQPALSTAGKSIVITGGGTGIGQAAALSFAKSGTSNLLLLGRRTAPLEETRTLITTSYPKTAVHIASADLTDRDSLDTAFTNFTKATGTPVDILFANAGFDGQRGPLSSMNVEDFAQNLTMNAVGNLNLVQAYLPHAPTAPKDGGKYRARIIHTSSAVVHAQVPTLGAYSTAKLAAAWMFDIVAKENPDIFVMNYHPGIIATSMDARGQEAGLSLEPKDDSKPACSSLCLPSSSLLCS